MGRALNAGGSEQTQASIVRDRDLSVIHKWTVDLQTTRTSRTSGALALGFGGDDARAERIIMQNRNRYDLNLATTPFRPASCNEYQSLATSTKSAMRDFIGTSTRSTFFDCRLKH